jgi:Protein of unknown function with PCYCGC motif
MSRVFLIATALSGLVFLGACSSKTGSTALGADAGSAKAADAVSPAAGDAKPADAEAAVAAVAPELPQPAIIVPPKPKPGAPHGPGFDMPLLELGGYAPPRPMDILKDAHIFTADHPEVASYIPCYCGCGSSGHKNNADCFVGARDKEGRVTAWVPHGAACAVCIDIAVESMRMRNSGASVAAIRKQIQSEYRPHFPSTETPTPAPPPGR